MTGPVHFDDKHLAQLIIGSDSDAVQTFTALGERFCQEKEWHKAVFCFEHAARTAANQSISRTLQVDIWINLGRVLVEMRRFEDAELWLRQAHQAAENFGLHTLIRMSVADALSSCLIQSGRQDDAHEFVALRQQLIHDQLQRFVSPLSADEYTSASWIECDDGTTESASAQTAQEQLAHAAFAEAIEATRDQPALVLPSPETLVVLSAVTAASRRCEGSPPFSAVLTEINALRPDWKPIHGRAAATVALQCGWLRAHTISRLDTTMASHAKVRDIPPHEQTDLVPHVEEISYVLADTPLILVARVVRTICAGSRDKTIVVRDIRDLTAALEISDVARMEIEHWAGRQ